MTRPSRLRAREQEKRASLRPPPAAPEKDPVARPPAGEVLAMLRRRGFRPRPWPPDLPFPPGFDAAGRECLARRLDHYAFRTCLRGAILRPAGFRPSEATRYVGAGAARAMAE
jgi:hypothetical protein